MVRIRGLETLYLAQDQYRSPESTASGLNAGIDFCPKYRSARTVSGFCQDLKIVLLFSLDGIPMRGNVSLRLMSKSIVEIVLRFFAHL